MGRLDRACPVPFATRRWALPLLMTLYLPEEENRRQGRRHKTPSELMQQMLAVLIHWFPDRQFIFTGDGGYGSHALDSFAHRHCRHSNLVSLFYPNANLYDPPPVVLQEAEPSAPQEGGQAARSSSGRGCDGPTEKAQRLLVRWRPPECRSSEQDGPMVQECVLIPILWVFVHDLTGTHRDTYLFTTDLSMTVPRIIETYTGCWNIETTFQDLPRVPRSGDNAGLEPEHSAAGCSMPVRHVYGSGVVVRRVAGAVHASAGGGLAWQARCNVLGRDHGGSALVVGGVGFCNPRSSRSLFKTQGPIPANRAQWASSGGIRPPDGPLAEAREGILRLSQRDLAITLRRGTRGAKMGKSRA